MDKAVESEQGGLEDAPPLEQTSRKSIHWDEGIQNALKSSVQAGSASLSTSVQSNNDMCTIILTLMADHGLLVTA